MLHPLVFFLIATQALATSDFPSLKKWVEKTKPTSIDAFISSLPESQTGLGEKYVLLHTSRSLDARAVSPEFPRVLLYGGNLVLSFTGNPEMEHFHRAEIVEWVPQKKAFHFHRILLKPGQPAYFESNPPLCTTCHDQRNPRPLWGSHPLYPEAYGSFADAFLSNEEQEAYGRHRKSLSLTSRYHPFPLQPSANRDFLAFLNSLNDRLIAAELNAWPLLHDYQWVLRAISEDCPQIEHFFPEDVLKNHLTQIENQLEEKSGELKAVEWLETLTKNTAIADWGRRIDYYQQTFPKLAPIKSPNLDPEYRRIGATRLVLEGMNFPMQSWSMNHSPGGYHHTYDFFDGTNGIKRILKKVFPEENDSCEILKSKSLKALSKRRP